MSSQPLSCNRCGQSFQCQMDTKACWCTELPVVSNIPSQYENCLCPSCLNHFAQGPSALIQGDLIEGQDFYYNKNLFVFTDQYHLKRGSCCGNGCVNCPY